MLSHQKLFQEKSDLYARARPTYPDGFYEYLAGQCERRNNAWDCACGTGQAAVALARYFRNVEATDISPSQIENAVSASNISYSVQPSEKTDFKDQSFDLITVALALHWLELEQFWKEVDRVLKPGGILAVFGYSFFRVTEELDVIFKESIRDKVYSYWNPRVFSLWNQYSEVKFPYEPVKVPNFPMELSLNLFQLFDYVHSWSAVRACMRVEGDEFFEKAFEQMAKVWGDPEQPRTVRMDFFAQVRKK